MICPTIDFPATDYSSFLATFVDDLGIYTPKTLPSSYKGQYTPNQYHLLATDAVWMEDYSEEKYSHETSLYLPRDGIGYGSSTNGH